MTGQSANRPIARWRFVYQYIYVRVPKVAAVHQDVARIVGQHGVGKPGLQRCEPAADRDQPHVVVEQILIERHLRILVGFQIFQIIGCRSSDRWRPTYPPRRRNRPWERRRTSSVRQSTAPCAAIPDHRAWSVVIPPARGRIRRRRRSAIDKPRGPTVGVMLSSRFICPAKPGTDKLR